MTKQKIAVAPGMSFTRRVVVALALPLVTWLTACSGAGANDSVADRDAAMEVEASPVEPGREHLTDKDLEDVTASTSDATSDAAPSDTADAKESQGSEEKATLRPFDFPYKNTVDVETSIAPLCVEHGETIELSVTTPPEAALAYQAVYSDNKSGAGAPFGEGYGGNDKGYADGSGHYTSTWVVAPHAPAGRARADVFVGFEGKWGYASSRFAVADENGSCPSEWLEGDD